MSSDCFGLFSCLPNKQQVLFHGFIHAQNRLNGEPLERYIKPFGGGYYFVLPGMKGDNTYLGEGLMKA